MGPEYKRIKRKGSQRWALNEEREERRGEREGWSGRKLVILIETLKRGCRQLYREFVTGFINGFIKILFVLESK